MTAEQLAESTLADLTTLESLIAQLVADGSAENTAGSWRLTAAGKLRATELFAEDRATVGDERAAALLDEFHVLDARMKALVTAWQVRDVGGEQTFNDHSDAAYDAGILDDLATLHADTARGSSH